MFGQNHKILNTALPADKLNNMTQLPFGGQLRHEPLNLKLPCTRIFRIVFYNIGLPINHI